MLQLTDWNSVSFFWFSTDLKSMTVSTTSADRNRNDDYYQLHHPVAIDSLELTRVLRNPRNDILVKTTSFYYLSIDSMIILSFN